MGTVHTLRSDQAAAANSPIPLGALVRSGGSLAVVHAYYPRERRWLSLAIFEVVSGLTQRIDPQDVQEIVEGNPGDKTLWEELQSLHGAPCIEREGGSTGEIAHVFSRDGQLLVTIARDQGGFSPPLELKDIVFPDPFMLA